MREVLAILARPRVAAGLVALLAAACGVTLAPDLAQALADIAVQAAIAAASGR